MVIPMVLMLAIGNVTAVPSGKTVGFASPMGKVTFDGKAHADKGTVQLSGFVRSRADINKAVEVAKGVAGVTSVKNDMVLKGTQ